VPRLVRPAEVLLDLGRVSQPRSQTLSGIPFGVELVEDLTAGFARIQRASTSLSEPRRHFASKGLGVRVPLAATSHPWLHHSPIRLSQGGTPTTARESGGCHSDFTALLVPPGVPPAVQAVQTGPIRRGSQMVEVEAGQGRG
jgi:hypothetical protein